MVLPGWQPASVGSSFSWSGDSNNFVPTGLQFSTLVTGNGAVASNNQGASLINSAVPEPASWAMMLLGFGMVGGAARYRRRSTRIAFA